MSGLSIQETDLPIDDYLNNIGHDGKKADAEVIIEMMKKASGQEPKVWGNNQMIGFGKYKYQRKQGKEEYEWFIVGFAARKTKISLYFTSNISQEQELLNKLGKYKLGKGCLYINKLADVDLEVLQKLITKSAKSN
jgi:hypothetical protein